MFQSQWFWKSLVPPSLASQNNLSPSQTDWSCQSILKPVLCFPLLLQLLSLQIQTFNWTSFLLLPFASLSWQPQRRVLICFPYFKCPHLLPEEVLGRPTSHLFSWFTNILATFCISQSVYLFPVFQALLSSCFSQNCLSLFRPRGKYIVFPSKPCLKATPLRRLLSLEWRSFSNPYITLPQT